MKQYDMRFSIDLCRQMIGQKFLNYRYNGNNVFLTITQTAGLFIGDQIYKLTNLPEPVECVDSSDDIGVYRLTQIQDSSDISEFDDVVPTDFMVGKEIKYIMLVNEFQRLPQNGEVTYEVWATKAIIFCFGEEEIRFETDNAHFSEQITIRHCKSRKIMAFDSSNEYKPFWDDGTAPDHAIEICLIE